MFSLTIRLKNGRIIKDPSAITAGETPKVGDLITHHVSDNPITLRILHVLSPSPIPPSTLTIDEVEAAEMSGEEVNAAIHPNVKAVWHSCRIELPDRAEPHWVLAVQTDLVLDPMAPGYEQGALKSLTEAVERERQRLGMDKAEIWTA